MIRKAFGSLLETNIKGVTRPTLCSIQSYHVGDLFTEDSNERYLYYPSETRGNLCIAKYDSKTNTPRIFAMSKYSTRQGDISVKVSWDDRTVVIFDNYIGRIFRNGVEDVMVMVG